MTPHKVDTSNLQELLDQIRTVTEEDIRDTFHVFVHSPDGNISYEYYLIRFEDDKIREDDFIDRIYQQIVAYILPYSETRPEGFERMTKKELERYDRGHYTDHVEAANEILNKKDPYAGEMGEILLFLILESKGIIQLLNKMNLKTSPEIAVHGLDAIHIQVKEDKIILHYGQSKIRGNIGTAIAEAIDDAEGFLKDRRRQKHEFRLARYNIDKIKFEKHAKTIPYLLSPYHRDKKNLGKVNSILVGYQWEELGRPDPSGKKDVETFAIESYKAEHNAISLKISKKIAYNTELADKKWFFFVIPFPDLRRIREKWRVKIGVIPKESEIK